MREAPFKLAPGLVPSEKVEALVCYGFFLQNRLGARGGEGTPASSFGGDRCEGCVCVCV